MGRIRMVVGWRSVVMVKVIEATISNNVHFLGLYGRHIFTRLVRSLRDDLNSGTVLLLLLLMMTIGGHHGGRGRCRCHMRNGYGQFHSFSCIHTAGRIHYSLVVTNHKSPYFQRILLVLCKFIQALHFTFISSKDSQHLRHSHETTHCSTYSFAFSFLRNRQNY